MFYMTEEGRNLLQKKCSLSTLQRYSNMPATNNRFLDSFAANFHYFATFVAGEAVH